MERDSEQKRMAKLYTDIAKLRARRIVLNRKRALILEQYRIEMPSIERELEKKVREYIRLRLKRGDRPSRVADLVSVSFGLVKKIQKEMCIFD